MACSHTKLDHAAFGFGTERVRTAGRLFIGGAAGTDYWEVVNSRGCFILSRHGGGTGFWKVEKVWEQLLLGMTPKSCTNCWKVFLRGETAWVRCDA